MFNAICGLGGWDWDWMVIKSHKPSKNTFRANTIHGNTRSKISTLLSDLNPPATATQLVFQYSNRTCPVTKNPTCWALLEHARVIITQLLSQVMVSVKARWDQINHACLSPPLPPSQERPEHEKFVLFGSFRCILLQIIAFFILLFAVLQVKLTNFQTQLVECK